MTACWLACTGTAQAALFGLSDQREDSLADPRLRALPIDHARLIVPWDAAILEPEPVDRWITAARSARLVPLVAFERSRSDGCPGAPCHLPSATEFADAFAAFTARWPDVDEFTPWNEPNHPHQPTASAPAAAARLHDVLRAQCPRCTVVAGDVVDSASMKSWLRTYRENLTLTPHAWGIHNYGDTTYDRPSYTEWLIENFDGPVWITETGGIVSFSADGRAVLPHDEERAARSVQKALALVDRHPDRIARAYLYQWVAAPWEPFDAGLIRYDRSPRPSLDRLRERLGARPPQAVAGAESGDAGAGSPQHMAGDPQDPAGRPATAGPAAGGRPRAGVVPAARISRAVRRRGGYSVTLRCPAARPRGCQGRLELLARRPAGPAARLGSSRLALRSGQSRTHFVAVRGADRRREARHALGLVALTILRDPATISERFWRWPR